jgi:hypothetical protein
LAQGRVVWWNAAEYGALYYEVPLMTGASGKAGAALLLDPAATTLAGLRAPDVVITSKPDVFDNAGAVNQYLTEGHYRAAEHFPAFTVWRR